MNVANASFSQMPFHQRIVTRLPNHWWASLVCDHVGDVLQSGWVACSGSTSNSDSRYVMQPVFSIAPCAKSGRAIMSTFLSGRATRSTRVKNRMENTAASSAKPVR